MTRIREEEEDWWLRFNYFRFWKKQTTAILEFYFRFWSRPFCRNLHVVLHQTAEFIQIGTSTAEIWRHIHFSRWRPRPLNTTSGFVFVDVTAFRMSKSISKPNFVEMHIIIIFYIFMSTNKFDLIWFDTSIGGWDITISVFEIQTSAMSEFYLRFRSRPFRRNLHVILHQAAEFSPNRNIRRWNMTSYPFLKMAAPTAKYYFRFRICWCYCL